MSWLEDYQRDFVQALFARDAEPHLARLGPARFRVYRRMVRRRLRDLLEFALPRYVRVLGPAGFEEVTAAWFEETPPSSPFLRDVVGEHERWLEGRGGFPGTPAFTLDLARYEAALREVEWLAEEAPTGRVAEGELSMERPIVLHPAHRRVSLGHAVHRLTAEEDRVVGDAEPGAFELLVYRDPESHEPRVLELDRFAARLLADAVQRPLVEAARGAATAAGLAIDGSFVATFTDLVADLTTRGVLLGSRPDA